VGINKANNTDGGPPERPSGFLYVVVVPQDSQVAYSAALGMLHFVGVADPYLRVHGPAESIRRQVKKLEGDLAAAQEKLKAARAEAGNGARRVQRWTRIDLPRSAAARAASEVRGIVRRRDLLRIRPEVWLDEVLQGQVDACLSTARPLTQALFTIAEVGTPGLEAMLQLQAFLEKVVAKGPGRAGWNPARSVRLASKALETIPSVHRSARHYDEMLDDDPLPDSAWERMARRLEAWRGGGSLAVEGIPQTVLEELRPCIARLDALLSRCGSIIGEARETFARDLAEFDLEDE
jgi:hypothetical protein